MINSNKHFIHFEQLTEATERRIICLLLMQQNPAVKETIQTIHETTEQADHKLIYDIFDFQQSTPLSTAAISYNCAALVMLIAKL